MTPADTEFDPEQVVVRDKRRIDPESGQVREEPSDATLDGDPIRAAEPVEGDVVDGGPVDGEPDLAEEPVELTLDSAAAELTADLQRVSAEYANYRKRVERDRVTVVEMATAGVLTGLLPVLDDINRAREHGDLEGAFKSVGEALEAVTAKLGLETFGAVGEPFDPAVHEALLQAEPDPTATVAVCAALFQPGYRVGARILRPARVSVAEPGAVEPTA